jgi:hypothetical protein
MAQESAESLCNSLLSTKMANKKKTLSKLIKEAMLEFIKANGRSNAQEVFEYSQVVIGDDTETHITYITSGNEFLSFVFLGDFESLINELDNLDTFGRERTN